MDTWSDLKGYFLFIKFLQLLPLIFSFWYRVYPVLSWIQSAVKLAFKCDLLPLSLSSLEILEFLITEGMSLWLNDFSHLNPIFSLGICSINLCPAHFFTLLVCFMKTNKQIFKNAKQHKQAVPEGSLPSLLPRKMEFSSGVSNIVCILSLPLKWLSQNAKGIFYYQALFDAQKHEKNVLRFPLIMFRNKEKRKKLAFNSRFNLKILCPLKRKETCLV